MGDQLDKRTDTAKVVRLNARDNVVIALRDLESGADVPETGAALVSSVPRGHKIATTHISAGESVSMIDTDPDHCAEARKMKGVNVYCDDATEVKVLRRAGVPTAKSIIVATPSDKVNILVSQVVRSNFGDKRMVARANTTSNVAAFEEAGIETMSPVQASVAILENMVLRPSLFQLLATTKPEDEKIDEVRVRSRRSINRSLADLHLQGVLVVALRRDGKLIQPSGKTVLRYDDILTLLGNEDSLEIAKEVFQHVD